MNIIYNLPDMISAYMSTQSMFSHKKLDVNCALYDNTVSYYNTQKQERLSQGIEDENSRILIIGLDTDNEAISGFSYYFYLIRQIWMLSYLKTFLLSFKKLPKCTKDFVTV